MKKFYLTAGESFSFNVPIHYLFGRKQMAQWFCHLMNTSEGKFKNVKFKAIKK